MDTTFMDPGMLADGPEASSQSFAVPVLNNFLDPFATVRESTGSLNADTGLDCEIKAYEKRYNAQGEVETLQVGRRRTINLEKQSSLRAAIVVIRQYDKQDELLSTELWIQSPHIKKALRQVIKDYPGVNINAPTVIIWGIPRCLFHYRRELADYARSLQDQTGVQHVSFIQCYAYQQMFDATFSYSLYMENPGVEPGLEFHNLWMAFRPGALIFMKENGVSRILRFDSMEKSYDHWNIHASFIDSDGKVFGYREEIIHIKSYDLYKPLAELGVYPLEHHVMKQSIVQGLCERGQRFLSLQGIHYRYYQGTIWAPSPLRSSTERRNDYDDDYDSDEEDELSYPASIADGRIIIDTATYRQSAQPRHLVNFTEVLGPCGDKRPQFNEKQLLICAHTIPAFSLSSRRWWRVMVDKVKDIEFSTNAFDKLILPTDQKEMVHALVNVHANNLLKFDDVIAGKGKGMVFLLHGESGTGKTLTAESVAEFTNRPLYVVGCADLGVTIGDVEKNLTRILRMSTEWNAILLLDEADVFLERRSTHDLERNGLVSVFLRVLEYFEGILFLTTNRINAFDKAVRSRVHLAIHFPKLNSGSRRKLWELFLNKALEASQAEGWDDDLLDSLAERELNGRQIKNAVRTALALSTGKNERISASHLYRSLESLTHFDAQLEPDFADSPADAPTPMDYARYTVGRKRQRLN